MTPEQAEDLAARILPVIPERYGLEWPLPLYAADRERVASEPFPAPDGRRSPVVPFLAGGAAHGEGEPAPHLRHLRG